MAFCFDTSAILDAWVRYYPRDVFPSIWEKMDQAATTGEIYFIDEVVSELQRKDDGIYEWVRAREMTIVSIDTDIQNQLSSVMKKYARLIDTRKNRSGGDPWVIALALSRKQTIVTGEKPSTSLDRPKIPDVCNDLRIPWIDVLQFFRCQGWRL